jgi:predicted alpha/beta hydrolase family esterase
VHDRPFLILHGWQGSGPDHWQTWLAERLGEDASYPTLPEPDTPRLDDWLNVLRSELEAAAERRRVVICHSLSCVLWLHHARQVADTAVERVLLVAPPSPSVDSPDLDGFFPLAVERGDLQRAAASTRLVCSDNDPYCPEGAREVYGIPLGIETDLIPGAGHINPDAGYGPWPAVERWCLDGTGRLSA